MSPTDGLAPDVYARHCPTRLVLDRIGDKWTVLLVGRMEAGPQRFSALRRDVAGISQKVLTQTLRGLERDGIVVRTEHPGTPRRVDYALTALGGTLASMLAGIRGWAEAHIDEVRAAQATYDDRARGGAGADPSDPSDDGQSPTAPTARPGPDRGPACDDRPTATIGRRADRPRLPR